MSHLKTKTRVFITIIVLFAASVFNYAQELKLIQLPQPQTEIGKPLMQVLKLRKSTRSFASEKLPMQELSNILWAAAGINRPESGKRTAPSAMNWQEIDVYVVMQEGTYVYNAKENVLSPIAGDDLRGYCGVQDFVKVAPVNLVYVANLAKISQLNDEAKNLYVPADCGFIAQNVYLYCASQGLSVVVRGMIERDKLSKVLNLKKDQEVLLSQTIGYGK